MFVPQFPHLLMPANLPNRYENKPEFRVKYTREYLLSLRSKELFPVPTSIIRYGNIWGMDGVDEIPEMFTHGAIFDIMYRNNLCLSCGNSNDNFKKMFVCNICGVRELFSRYDNLERIRSHLGTHCDSHPYSSDATIGTFDVDIRGENIARLQSIRKLVYCEECSNGDRHHNNKNKCTNCVACVMCGLEYESECGGIPDLEIKNHIEKCKRVLELRGKTKTLPEQIKADGMPIDSSRSRRALIPLPGSKDWTKFHLPAQKIVKMYSSPAMKSLINVTICECCAQMYITCKICKFRFKSIRHESEVMAIIYNHLYKNKPETQQTIDCESAIKYIRISYHPADVYKKLCDIYQDMRTKPVNKLEYLFEDGCFTCGDVFETLSDMALLDHIKTCP